MNNALIVLWNGNELPDYISQKIGEMLIVNNIAKPENLTIVYKDNDGIASSLLRDITSIKTDLKNDNVSEAVKQAVIYIGKRFEASLTSTNGPIGNIAAFAIELSNAVATARRNISFTGVGLNDELLTAIEIISTSKGNIPSALSRKYHFTQNVVDVIKKVYNSY